jgi:hypothetical protein
VVGHIFYFVRYKLYNQWKPRFFGPWPRGFSVRYVDQVTYDIGNIMEDRMLLARSNEIEKPSRVVNVECIWEIAYEPTEVCVVADIRKGIIPSEMSSRQGFRSCFEAVWHMITCSFKRGGG